MFKKILAVEDFESASISVQKALEDLETITAGAQPERWKVPPVVDEQTALTNLAMDLATVFNKSANLIFTNSRRLAEMLADELNQIATH